MNIVPRLAPAPPAAATGRRRQRHDRYFLAWLLERCATPRPGTVQPRLTARER
ncbi:MAG TPA: hypothetical protein VMR06_15460 [Dokdonella sp.]|uniref:hypothetical protein n=1 Tax=Dokdonella sp. TaxID=2291710 RepID=UPI002CAB918A|nr:hypothetical protein [Dokdonella sp.]HUD43390.1 hypothetical protein [Dokdonella sp.]